MVQNPGEPGEIIIQRTEIKKEVKRIEVTPQS